MAALEALPLSVIVSALPFTIFSAASPLLASASALALTIFSAGCLAMAGNLQKARSATLPTGRWQHSDASNASCQPSERSRTPRSGLLRALDDQIEEDGSSPAKNSHSSCSTSRNPIMPNDALDASRMAGVDGLR